MRQEVAVLLGEELVTLAELVAPVGSQVTLDTLFL